MKLSTNAGRRLAAWSAAAVVAFLMLLPDLLMIRHRRFFQRGYPEVAASWGLSGRYTSIAPLDDPDMNFYAARARVVVDEGWSADTYAAGRRSARLATQDSLGFFGVGLLYKATGDMSSAWLGARAVAGVLWVLALTALLLEFSGNFTASLSASIVLTLFVDLFFDVLRPTAIGAGLAGHLKGLRDAAIHAVWPLGNYQYNFGPTRLMNPGWSYPALFAGLAWLARAAKGSWRAAALAGTTGGAMVYIHADVWHVFVAAGGVFLACLWAFERKFPRQVAAAGVWALLLSVPWIVHNYPIDMALLERAHVMRGPRAFNWPGLAYLAAASALIVSARRRRQWPALLFGCVFAGIFVMSQSQFISGVSLGTANLRWTLFGAFFAAATAAGLLARARPERRGYLWAAALAAVVAAGRQVSYAAQRFPFQALPKDAEKAMDYLRREAPEGAVVAALGPQENMILPIYTRLKTLNVSGCMLSSDIPTADIFERLRYSLELFDVPPQRLIERLEARGTGTPKWNRALWSGVVDWQDREWDNFFYFYWMTLPPSQVIERLKREGKTPVDRGARVDYLWVGTFERGLMERPFRGKPVYSNATVAIYRR